MQLLLKCTLSSSSFLHLKFLRTKILQASNRNETRNHDVNKNENNCTWKTRAKNNRNAEVILHGHHSCSTQWNFI